MKTLRVVVLLLVCALLPFRGALAATLLCAEPGQSGEVTAAEGHAHHGVVPGDAHDVDPAGAHAAHGHAHVDAPSAEDSAQGDGCHICASGCHATAMVAEPSTTPAAMPVASIEFPAVNAPAPDFQSEGQDRPPRAI